MHVECGHDIFGKHSNFTVMSCRKCNFVLIDIEVRLLLTFLASMKVGTSVSKVYVSDFGCLHVKSLPFSSIHFQDLT